MKKCSKCGIEKEECEFFFKNKERQILHSQCKECKRKLDKESYHENKNDRKKKIKQRSYESKKILSDYVLKLKQSSSCSKCGDNRWYVLDFHHIDNKIDIIPNIVKNGSFNKLKEELDKCIILCSNCHRELHYFERLGIGE